MKEKRGVSDIITTVLIILLVLAAIIIVWNVVKKTLSEQAAGIDVEILAVNLKIKNVYIDKASDLMQFSVERGADKANVSQLKIIVANASSNLMYFIEAVDVPLPLSTKIYVLNIAGLRNPVKIAVYPVSNKGKLGIPSIYDIKGNEPVSPNSGGGGWAETSRNPGSGGGGGDSGDNGGEEEECVPICESEGKNCGDDTCGGSCGTCGSGETCSNGLCVPGEECSCEGKNCGDDTCGGSCGTCGSGETCSNGICMLVGEDGCPFGTTLFSISDGSRQDICVETSRRDTDTWNNAQTTCKQAYTGGDICPGAFYEDIFDSEIYNEWCLANLNFAGVNNEEWRNDIEDGRINARSGSLDCSSSVNYDICAGCSREFRCCVYPIL